MHKSAFDAGIWADSRAFRRLGQHACLLRSTSVDYGDFDRILYVAIRKSGPSFVQTRSTTVDGERPLRALTHCCDCCHDRVWTQIKVESWLISKKLQHEIIVPHVSMVRPMRATLATPSCRRALRFARYGDK
jgi:hypothetical protein